ncbi:sulfurtransferase-like selenium metabolism protein YedF [Endozoicomonas sp. Mp262]|uniref:sulfurtransferase-like selenium metabolism protein YedF n=1 Tax=Endozoicomonas sp. Mp262 TaxID=2919499 RepID=UPI0021DA9389
MIESGDGYVIAFKRDQMGSGSDELGATLIKAYINSLLELNNKPSTLVFYNGGVKLATYGSGVEESLAALESQGIKLLLCGTCVNHFELKAKLAAGEISNMYTISETLAQASHVVYP